MDHTTPAKPSASAGLFDGDLFGSGAFNPPTMPTTPAMQPTNVDVFDTTFQSSSSNKKVSLENEFDFLSAKPARPPQPTQQPQQQQRPQPTQQQPPKPQGGDFFDFDGFSGPTPTSSRPQQSFGPGPTPTPTPKQKQVPFLFLLAFSF